MIFEPIADLYVTLSAGNAAGIIISFLCCAISSWFSPDNYDFDIMRRHNFSTTEEVKIAPTTHEEDLKDIANAEKAIAVDAQGESLPINNVNDVDEAQLYKDFKVSVWSTGIAFFVLCVSVPPSPFSSKSFILLTCPCSPDLHPCHRCISTRLQQEWFHVLGGFRFHLGMGVDFRCRYRVS